MSSLLIVMTEFSKIVVVVDRHFFEVVVCYRKANITEGKDIAIITSIEKEISSKQSLCLRLSLPDNKFG